MRVWLRAHYACACLAALTLLPCCKSDAGGSSDVTPAGAVVSLPYSVAFGGSLVGQQALQERAHKRSQSKVNAAVLEQHVAGFERFQMWEYLLPTFSCPIEDRVGAVFDGGMYMCGKQTLLQDPDCMVASVGTNKGVDFEQELLNGTPCQVHMFDPAPTPAKRQLSEDLHRLTLHERAWCQGRSPAAGFNSTEILMALQSLQGSWIDVLKIDAEGAEWGLLDALLEEPGPLPFTQIQMELHLWPGTYLWPGGYEDQLATIQRLLRRGFRIFHRHVNDCGNGNVYEVAFIQVDVKGNVVGRPATESAPPTSLPPFKLMGQDIGAQQRLAEELYRVSLQRHEPYVTGSGRWAAQVPDDQHRPQCGELVWDAVAASYNCPLAERVGGLADGGAWLCARETLLGSRSCTVYNFGASHNTSFADAIALSSSCEVMKYRHIVAPPHARSRKHLHSASRATAYLGELLAVMAENQHAWLDTLRVELATRDDFEAFVHLVEELEIFPTTQLQLRLNHPGSNKAVIQLFELLRSRNLRTFHYEPIMHSTNTAEYALIQVNPAGDLVMGAHEALPLLGNALLTIYWKNLKEWAASHV